MTYLYRDEIDQQILGYLARNKKGTTVQSLMTLTGLGYQPTLRSLHRLDASGKVQVVSHIKTNKKKPGPPIQIWGLAEGKKS